MNFKGAQRETSGITIGGAFGHNWQRCNTVFGIEGEFSWTDIDRSFRLQEITWRLPFLSARNSMDWYGAIKMRTGLAFDSLLLYLTGDMAFAKIEYSGVGDPGGMVAGTSYTNSDTRWGWVVGAGTEYALSNRVTIRSEVTYTRFEDKSFNFAGTMVGPGGAAAPFNLGLIGMDELWH